MSAVDDFLSQLIDVGEAELGPEEEPNEVVPEPTKSKPPPTDFTFSQWSVGSNGKFAPVGATIPRLKAGVYIPVMVSQHSAGLEAINIHSDSIYHLPDMATQNVLEEVDRFWSNEEKYRRHKLLYKRGLLLYGVPGSGKTVTLKLLMKDLIDRDGVVVVIQHIGMAIMALKDFRRVEPSRNLILIMEDLDEIIRWNGESPVLSLLDGEDNIDRVLILATTNHPERLGARIINRPSRFDRRIEVAMPSFEARKVYLQHATSGCLDEALLDKWSKDTDKLSIAHLRELVAAVYCLDQPYDEVLARLLDMCHHVKEESGFKEAEPMGFGRPKPKAAFGFQTGSD